MGSSISAIYDDYDEYEALCKSLNINTVGIYNSFYKHQERILEHLGFKNIYEYWQDFRKKEERDRKINQII